MIDFAVAQFHKTVEFQNSGDDGGVPADKTKHREDHQDYDKHDGPHKTRWLVVKSSTFVTRRLASD
ncbi:MAG: hypothetical protein LC753_06010 [Acidobacteria bacterium]|nr:hypothetical protein [Acidobacteriota bacterium]MCA1649844.1 hypothetical protein [Acidobacteriota bacterium]